MSRPSEILKYTNCMLDITGIACAWVGNSRIVNYVYFKPSPTKLLSVASLVKETTVIIMIMVIECCTFKNHYNYRVFQNEYRCRPMSILKEYYEIFKITIVPITNLFPKYHMSNHYRTCIK